MQVLTKEESAKIMGGTDSGKADKAVAALDANPYG